MIHIRAHAQGNVLVKQMLAAAFKTMVKATRNHVGEILSCGRFAVESITEDLRKRPGPMPMTSMTDDVPSGCSHSAAISTSAPISSAPTLGQESLTLSATRPWSMDWIMMRDECREGYQNADHTTWSPLVGHVMADGETLYANQVRLHAILRPFSALSRHHFFGRASKRLA